MGDLRVSMLQQSTRWHDAAGNRKYIEALLAEDPTLADSDLLILPETFTTGFSNAVTTQAETMSGESIDWMQEQSQRYNCVVTGSLIIEEDGDYYNRLIWMPPNGQLTYYDKKHLFRMADEHQYFTAGASQPEFELQGWLIRPTICYDLRFPVWCRVTQPVPYDLMFCVANWPSPRHQVWIDLLKARALENQAYVIGVNRSGKDHNKLDYLGNSIAFDAKGQTLLDAGDACGVFHCHLEKGPLDRFREKFPLALDADHFTLD